TFTLACARGCVPEGRCGAAEDQAASRAGRKRIGSTRQRLMAPNRTGTDQGRGNSMRALPIFARFAALAAAGWLATRAPPAQTYPDRPVRVIAGYAPGGGGDILVRYYAAQLEKATGQKFLVENRVGANGKIATDATLMAKPDGYTLLIHGTAAVVGN